MSINRSGASGAWGERPLWLTFDCYGTLVQWDEGLAAAAARVVARRGGSGVPIEDLVAAYDGYEHAFEAESPHRSFRVVAGEALRCAMADLGLQCDASDADELTSAISAMPPFPDVPDALARLKHAGFGTCIISNTDDDILAGNLAQWPAGLIDRVVTADKAGAYKPSRRIFEHAWRALGVDRQSVVHICASPHLDHAAARELGFRCIWIDRGTGRKLLHDYVPDATLPTLGHLPGFFEEIGWMSRAGGQAE